MQKKCKCLVGHIGEVDKIDISFDYNFYWGEESLEGTAKLSLLDFEADYKIKPEVIDKTDQFNYHEEGMLHLAVERFKLKAREYPITVEGSRKDVIESAFGKPFKKWLGKNKNLDKTQLKLLENMINNSIVGYE